jgi:IPT/TIG domain
MMRERILQCAARPAWAAVIIATLTACSATSPSSTAALGGPSQSTTAGASQASTTACSTQGGGGDNIPVPCAPTTSPSGHGLTPPPATFTGEATPSACSDPTVIRVSPGTGSEAGGDFVTITGTGFGLGLEVFFGRSPSLYALRSATEVIATSPPGTPGAAAVTVSCAGVVSTPSPAVDFTYQAVARSPADGSPDAMPPPSPSPVAPSPSA